MVDNKTTLDDLYLGTPMREYAKRFWYDVWFEGWTGTPIHEMNVGLWPVDQMVESHQYAEELYGQGLLHTYFLNEGVDDTNIIQFRAKKKAKFALLAAGGGYCCVCCGIETLPTGMYLHKLGYNVFFLDYSCRDKAYLERPYNDLLKAIKHIIDHAEELNVDPEDFILSGCSAGGHLIAEYGTDHHGYMHHDLPKPAAVGLAYPVITMGVATHGGSRDLRIGKEPSQELIDEYSFEKHVDSNYPKTLIWQCEHDDTVPFVNSIMMDEALTKAHVPHIYHHYDSTAHGWGIGTGTPAEGWVDELLVLAGWKK